MLNQIQNSQTAPVSEPVLSGFQKISILMTEKDMKYIYAQANSMNKSIDDYIISAGYYNPMVLQMEQIRDFIPVWSNCKSIVMNIEEEDKPTKEMLYEAFSNLYLYIAPLLRNEYLNTSFKQTSNTNMYQTSTLTANEAQGERSFQFEVPNHVFQYLNKCAELMKVDISNYLLYSATKRMYIIPTSSFEVIFLYLRNIGYLLKYVYDFDKRDLLLKNLASIWHMFCNAMIALEIYQYHPNYIGHFPENNASSQLLLP